MSQNLPDYNLADLSGGPIDQIDQFDNILDKAREKGVISDTPSDHVETFDLEKQRIRIQTIASRLWLLGYLPRKYEPKIIDRRLNKIKAAVGRFQKEAGLKEDLWVGDKTWYALDQLVSFESELDQTYWFKNGQINPQGEKALLRAVRLRLWSLGLYGNKPKANFEGLDQSDLSNLGKIIDIFLFKPTGYQVQLNQDTLNLLFDQDLLTSTIASRKDKNNPDAFRLNIPKTNNKTQIALAQTFIVNCAKIELWLLGYEIEIDGKDDYLIDTSSQMYSKMVEFYMNFESKSRTEARSLSKSIKPSLFTGMAASSEISEEYREDDASEEIASAIKTEDDVEEAYGYVKKKGLRLWDGIKRVWRWIKRIGKKVISFIKKNIFRGFFRFVTKAFKIIKTGVSAVIKSIGVYVKGRLSTPGIEYTFAKDLDTRAIITAGPESELIDESINALTHQTKAFSVSCRIIGWVFYIFKRVVTGVFGWARLLISLIKGFKEIKQLYLDFKDLGIA